jgi:hypothetical protein
MTERTGIAAVNEHFPKDDKSCSTATFFIITSIWPIHFKLYLSYHKSAKNRHLLSLFNTTISVFFIN